MLSTLLAPVLAIGILCLVGHTLFDAALPSSKKRKKNKRAARKAAQRRQELARSLAVGTFRDALALTRWLLRTGVRAAHYAAERYSERRHTHV